jgi:hypothetical protein
MASSSKDSIPSDSAPNCARLAAISCVFNISQPSFSRLPAFVQYHHCLARLPAYLPLLRIPLAIIAVPGLACSYGAVNSAGISAAKPGARAV